MNDLGFQFGEKDQIIKFISVKTKISLTDPSVYQKIKKKEINQLIKQKTPHTILNSAPTNILHNWYSYWTKKTSLHLLLMTNL